MSSPLKRKRERENENKTTPWPSTEYRVTNVSVSRKGLSVRVCKELPERGCVVRIEGEDRQRGRLMNTSLSAGQASKILIPF